MTLTAGRELDSLVAERVMGWVWDNSRCRLCGWPLAELAEDGCVIDNCSQRPLPSKRADEPAHFSTNIVAAWTVVEYLKKHIEMFDVGWSPSHGGEWYCVFLKIQNVSAREVAWKAVRAHTAPIAICLAALKAVGENP